MRFGWGAAAPLATTSTSGSKRNGSSAAPRHRRPRPRTVTRFRRIRSILQRMRIRHWVKAAPWDRQTPAVRLPCRTIFVAFRGELCFRNTGLCRIMAKSTPARSSSRNRKTSVRRRARAHGRVNGKRRRVTARGVHGARTKRSAARRSGRPASSFSAATTTSASEISPALRAQFEKLGSRWKSLLPRLTKTNSAAASTKADRTAPARRRAPAKSKAKRR
jgi:hypothetical protein